MFDFNVNMFCQYKDYFFKVMHANPAIRESGLLFDGNREPCFPFYWQPSPTKFKSFEKQLMSPKKRVDKSVLDKLPHA